MRILLVEDEPSAARFIAKGLREARHAVDVATDGHGGGGAVPAERLRCGHSRRDAAREGRPDGVPRAARRRDPTCRS